MSIECLNPPLFAPARTGSLDAVSDQAPWQVRIALAPEEVGPIEAAMQALEPWERWGFRLPRIEEEAAPALVIEVRADTHAEAEAEAVEVYSRARGHAGLPAVDAPVLGALTPIFADAPHARLLSEAEGHIETGRPEWGVIRAQTACEMYAQLALDHIAIRLPDENKPDRLFRALTFLDRRDRALLRTVTGVAIGEQEWWGEYRLHVERRNAIVHAALSVSKDEALASLSAAHAFVVFLQARWSRAAGGEHSPPAPDRPQES